MLPGLHGWSKGKRVQDGHFRQPTPGRVAGTIPGVDLHRDHVGPPRRVSGARAMTLGLLPAQRESTPLPDDYSADARTKGSVEVSGAATVRIKIAVFPVREGLLGRWLDVLFGAVMAFWRLPSDRWAYRQLADSLEQAALEPDAKRWPGWDGTRNAVTERDGRC